jgi:hypothetical protein
LRFLELDHLDSDFQADHIGLVDLRRDGQGGGHVLVFVVGVILLGIGGVLAGDVGDVLANLDGRPSCCPWSGSAGVAMMLISSSFL